MDLSLSLEETRFRDELRAWLGQHAPKDWEHRHDGSIEQHFAFLRSWQKTLYDGGWAGISWPREYGGRGASLMQQVIFWQELARASAPPMANVIGLGMVGPTIIAFGTEAQKARFLPGILSADEIWCQGFSEPNAGSDLAGLQSDGRLDGEHFVVNGQKVWTSYGWAADWCELVVRTDPTLAEAQGPHGDARGHEVAGHRGSAAAADDRRVGIQRSVLPRRPRAGGERHRQGESGLGRVDRHAHARARHARGGHAGHVSAQHRTADRAVVDDRARRPPGGGGSA